jgi:hypothetical protein
MKLVHPSDIYIALHHYKRAVKEKPLILDVIFRVYMSLA